ncbi:hypothetical protein AYO22_04131 [Fonsecaea multimorphosa]|nr:hypothetical protein AYO22_04131 [Fonsecaea multimorphosa]
MPIFGYVTESGKREFNGSMTVSGFVVGVINKISSRSQGGTLPADWIKLFKCQQDDDGYDENDEMNDDDDNESDKTDSVPNHLWRTLVADRGPGGTSAPLWYHQACRYWLGEYSDVDITTDMIRDKKLPSMALEFIQRVRSVIWNRTLFTITDSENRQLFGLGPPNAKEVHSICVLHACSVPVVLRQVGGHWRLVGECFVYGMMDGEAMQVKKYVERTQEFVLR